MCAIIESISGSQWEPGSKQEKGGGMDSKTCKKTPATKQNPKPNTNQNLPEGCCECEKCIRVQGKNREAVEGRSTKGYETDNHKQLKKPLELKIAGGWESIRG